MKEKRDDKQKKKMQLNIFSKKNLNAKSMNNQPTAVSYYHTFSLFASTITQLPQQQKQLKPM